LLATDREVWGFDSRGYKIFCEVVDREWCPLSLMGINEELLEREVPVPV
jgi:hypothetical protein